MCGQKVTTMYGLVSIKKIEALGFVQKKTVLLLSIAMT
jgi:hypothetical protein